MRLPRLFRRSSVITAERIFEESLGISRLADGPTHPVYSPEARRCIAGDVAASFVERCDAARAAGAWSVEMQSLWDQLSDPTAEQSPETERKVHELAGLLHSRGF